MEKYNMNFIKTEDGYINTSMIEKIFVEVSQPLQSYDEDYKDWVTMNIDVFTVEVIIGSNKHTIANVKDRKEGEEFIEKLIESLKR